MLAAGVATLLAVLWIIWQRPQPVNMAAQVPAEALLYLEADDVPQILTALTETSAWREVAPHYGLNENYGKFSWFSQILANANLGSTASIIIGRAQIAVALMGVGTADAGESLKIRPQFAVVIETKSNRAGDFVESEIGAFARRQFGEVRVEKKSAGNAAWTIFRAAVDERDLFAAVSGTTVILGNDEAAVQACLDVKNGQRKSLADDQNLARMSVNTEREKAFAFGFVTPEGIKQLSNVGAVMAAGQMSEDPRAMSLLAQSLPPFVQKSVTAIGWTARRGLDDNIEDRFFIQMPPDLVARLREPLAEQERDNSVVAQLLPANLQSLTVYNLKNPQIAWRGVIFAMTTRLDAFSAAAFSQASSSLLAPYGIARADDFLGATNGALFTVQLATGEDAAIAVAGVKDAAALNKSRQTESGKRSDLINDFLLIGEPESLRICRVAREQNQTFQTQPMWPVFNDTKPTPSGTFVRTLTRDEETPVRFVKLFAKNKNAAGTVIQPGAPMPNWSWTISETALVREGVERRILSPFGLIGTLATSFAEK